ncbi:CMP-sialic acid transporter-like [Styela clava]
MAPSTNQTPAYVIKLVVLVLMSATTTAYLILLRWTRVVATDKYITTIAVALQEVIKFFMALVVLIWQNRSIVGAVRMIKSEAIDKPYDTLKMAVPSFVYALQNNMMYIALSNLDVPIQQILYQLKIPATALCSVFILRRSLSYQQWAACFMVFAGLAMVEYNPEGPYKSPQTTASDQNVFIGISAVMVAVFCSPFAGVYFEKMVKESDTSIWVRNLQMYAWTTTAAFLAVITKDLATVREKGFFFAYTPLVWVLLCIGGVNGLLVSLVLKYADNIVKCFAASVSIILSTILSYFIFQYEFGPGFIIGGMIVCSAICIYAIPLPCLGTKWTSSSTSKKISGASYDKLRSATLNTDNDEI